MQQDSEQIRVAISTSSFGELDDSPLNLLESAGIQVTPNPFGRRLTEPEIITHLNGIHGLLAGLEPLTRNVLESVPTLRAIARVGIGITNVDIEAAQDLDIRVSNTPEGPTTAVAEMTVAALLTLSRNILAANSALHAGQWQKSIGTGLRGIKVLFIGFGRIGQRTYEYLAPFGIQAMVYDPFIEQPLSDKGITFVSLEEGLAQADAITLHAAGDVPILGPDEFRMMRDGVILLNSARGKLVDEDALASALESGKVRSAWFDAFWEEPYRGKLIGFDQVLLTPHISTYTKQCRLSMEMAAVRNILQDLEIETD
ncbi:phosphoglycerate dehydrogenase [Candidatus Neomarinimicrobiota bacterium]